VEWVEMGVMGEKSGGRSVEGGEGRARREETDLGQLLVLREDGLHLLDIVLESKGL
jgi:hypothetical protein